MPRAPPHVYSCFVVNRTSEPIECNVHYDGRPEEDTFNEDVHVTIPAKDEKFFPRKIFQPDLPESYCRWVKIITQIRVKKQNGKFFKLIIHLIMFINLFEIGNFMYVKKVILYLNHQHDQQILLNTKI